MSIWFKPISLDDLESRNRHTLVDHLGIQFTDIGSDYLTAVMSVSEKTQQYMGILHGGASCVLAETVGSVAANCVVNAALYRAVGQEISASHIRPVPFGERVTGIARPIHLGQRSQVWEIKMYNEKNKINCISRLTMAIVTNV
ncbi:MAG: hotdog fold thioesterase [Gammaproteobacteria bacterium]|nr:hotdog fold thioesterase [Gammaproteobacteria bacterium]MCD8541992.1 hotdog fold thioesterase [Gammaproteobacteria bacterium]